MQIELCDVATSSAEREEQTGSFPDLEFSEESYQKIIKWDCTPIAGTQRATHGNPVVKG